VRGPEDTPLPSGCEEAFSMVMQKKRVRSEAGLARLLGEKGTLIDSRITKTRVVIGRATGDADIKLGGSKLVSRRHAEIFWCFTTHCWHVRVLSERNPIRVGEPDSNSELTLSSSSDPWPLPSPRATLECGGIRLAWLYPTPPLFGGHSGWSNLST